jgi:hypothetical protein
MPDAPTSNVVSIEHVRTARGSLPATLIRSEVYSRLHEDGTLEFGLRGCDSSDAAHHLLALSKLIGVLGEIVKQRREDLLDCAGRIVLNVWEASHA